MLLKPKAQTPPQLGGHPTLGGPAPPLKSGLVPTSFPTAFRTCLWPPPWPPRRPLDTKRVSQASFWTPFGSRFGSTLAIVAPCENLIIYFVFITKTPFGPDRVPNKTLACIHNASETTFCPFFSPPWRPRGAPSLKTEVPEGPEAPQKAPQNPSKSPQNPLWSAMLCFRASKCAPPDQK